MITGLDHVNILTARIEQMVAFYTSALGLETGWRPDFHIDGAWLYCNGRPIVHLVDKPNSAGTPAGRIEHFALVGSDQEGLINNLNAMQVEFKILSIPGTASESVNFEDPDKNHIEVIFGKVTPSGKRGAA